MENNFMDEEVTLKTIIAKLEHLNGQAQELIKSSRDANEAHYSITDSIIVLKEIQEKQNLNIVFQSY